MTPTLTPPHTSLNYSFLGWWFHIWTFLRFNSIFSRVFCELTHPLLCLISPSRLTADCISCQWSCYSLLQVIVKNINWCMAKSQYLYQPLGNIPAVSHKRCDTAGHIYILKPCTRSRLIHSVYTPFIFWGSFQKHGAIVAPRHPLTMLWDIKEWCDPPLLWHASSAPWLDCHPAVCPPREKSHLGEHGDRKQGCLIIPWHVSIWTCGSDSKKASGRKSHNGRFKYLLGWEQGGLLPWVLCSSKALVIKSKQA